MLRDNAEAEATGTLIWTSEFSDRARGRLQALFAIWVKDASVHPDQAARDADVDLRLQIGSGLGRDSIYWDIHVDSALRGWSSDLYPTLIEALVTVLSKYSHAATPVSYINTVLAEERIAYEFVNGELVEFESREMHAAVVAPTLRLLAGRPGWERVEGAYQDALRELGTDPSDAITDAGTALQEALTVLGCSGNALGPLIKSARSQGLLAAHDGPLLDGIQRVLDWVSADRSERGDGHKASSASRADAWFTVHVVGAILLRVADGPRSRT